MNARSDPPVSTGIDAERMLDALRNPRCYPHPVARALCDALTQRLKR